MPIGLARKKDNAEPGYAADGKDATSTKKFNYSPKKK